MKQVNRDMQPEGGMRMPGEHTLQLCLCPVQQSLVPPVSLQSFKQHPITALLRLGLPSPIRLLEAMWLVTVLQLGLCLCMCGKEWPDQCQTSAKETGNMRQPDSYTEVSWQATGLTKSRNNLEAEDTSTFAAKASISPFHTKDLTTKPGSLGRHFRWPFQEVEGKAENQWSLSVPPNKHSFVWVSSVPQSEHFLSTPHSISSLVPPSLCFVWTVHKWEGSEFPVPFCGSLSILEFSGYLFQWLCWDHLHCHGLGHWGCSQGLRTFELYSSSPSPPLKVTAASLLWTA